MSGMNGFILAGYTLLVVSPVGIAGQATPLLVATDTVITAEIPPWADGGSVRVSSVPVLSFGGLESSLWGVRAVVPIDGHRIAVLSGGTNEVILVDSTGRSVAAFGQAGGGPGEFENALDLMPVDGTHLAVLQARGTELFTAEGVLVESRRIRLAPGTVVPGSTAWPVRFAGDGGLLFTVQLLNERAPEEGVWRAREGLAYMGRGEETPKFLGWYNGLEQQAIRDQGRSTLVVPPFPKRTIVGAGVTRSQRSFAYDMAVGEIEVFDESGNRTRTIRLVHPPVTPKPRWIEAWYADRLDRERFAPRRQAIQRLRHAMVTAEHLAPFEDFNVDRLGFMWLRRLAPDSDQTLMDIYDPDGRRLAGVALPRGLRVGGPLWIDADRLYGVWIDSFGVETVRVYVVDRG